MITLDIKDRIITIAAEKDKEFTAVGYDTGPMGDLACIYAISDDGKLIKAPHDQVLFKPKAKAAKAPGAQ